jgi:hypothetical protein
MNSRLRRRDIDEPEIGDVDECVVERGEDTGNTEDEFTCMQC